MAFIPFIAIAILSENLTSSGIITFLAVAVVVVAAAIAFVLFNRKTHIAEPNTPMKPKFLAISSPMDEAWQLLHHMRNASNPMAIQKNLISYLISSMKSHISRSNQVARIYGAKSYRDLKPATKWLLTLTMANAFLFGASVTWTMMDRPPGDDPEPGISWLSYLLFATSLLMLPLFTLVFGPEFQSAFSSPGRWCYHRLAAIMGVFGGIATYIVRSRGWWVVLAIAMGLEGYRHVLPRIEQCPSNVPGVTFENMPAGAQERAMAKRGDWIHRHLEDVSETFSKLAVTSGDIKLLLSAIEADQTLVHAAYYTDDECIARIADWISEKGDMRSNAAIVADVPGDA